MISLLELTNTINNKGMGECNEWSKMDEKKIVLWAYSNLLISFSNYLFYLWTTKILFITYSINNNNVKT
jgi:hypothetical protein